MQDELDKCMCYYQSMIDMDSLMKGQDYPSLKDSYILFIYKYDPFIKEKNEDDFSKRLETYVKKR